METVPQQAAIIASSTITMTKLELFTNVIMHITILFAILTALLIYVYKTTSKKFNTKIANNLAKAVNVQLPPVGREPILKTLKNMSDALDSPDQVHDEHNNGLFQSIFIVNFSLALLVTMLVLVIKRGCEPTNFNFMHILGENLLTFTGIGVIELMFFKLVASKYVPTLPSAMSNLFIKYFTNN